MLLPGIFERFPGLRIAFLEGGAAWVPFFVDWLDRSYNESHYQVDLDGGLLARPGAGEKGSGYFKRLVKEGRIIAGFDCDDVGLGAAVQRVGHDPFLFATDFPHEVSSAKVCRHEIDELMERDDLTAANKETVLGLNAERLYRVGA
jgi:hypothetical protein